MIRVWRVMWWWSWATKLKLESKQKTKKNEDKLCCFEIISVFHSRLGLRTICRFATDIFAFETKHKKKLRQSEGKKFIFFMNYLEEKEKFSFREPKCASTRPPPAPVRQKEINVRWTVSKDPTAGLQTSARTGHKLYNLRKHFDGNRTAEGDEMADSRRSRRKVHEPDSSH